MTKLILVSLVSATILFTSCAGWKGSAKNIWNDPVVQAEISKAEQAAIDFWHNWVNSHLGGSRASAASNQSAIAQGTAHLQAAFPNMSANVVHDIVVAKAPR